MNLRNCCCLLFATLACTLQAQGPLDGYLKGKGVLDLAPSFSYNTADRFDGPSNQTYDLPYHGSMLALFAEYGLSRKTDLVATAAYVFTENKSGLQDGGLFVKYRPCYKDIGNGGKLGILLGGGLAFPLSDYEPLVTGALGQKAVSAPLRVIAQWETALGLFFNTTAGYTWRLDRLQDDDVAAIRAQRPDYEPVQPQNFTTLLFKAGFPAAHYYFDAWVEWQHSAGGADYQPGVPDLPQAYGVSYTQAGGTLYYSENGKNGFYLSGAKIFGGRNTSRLLRMTAGMVFRF
ncbi:MAG: hypothetical protein H6565_06910 [Lewinellaceae bacterium]|nr:hypothetical protein [Lewinellaceae bacterium]MCB9353757.1 hypothetical protein [Lewinellaceae bacterium]